MIHERRESIRPVLMAILLFSSTAAAQSYVISTVAGGVPPRTPASGVSVSFGGPQGVTTDGAGNAYFTSLDSVFKLDQSGVVTRIAGTARPGYSGDGGPAINAQLAFSCAFLVCGNGPNGLAVDSSGNLFIADTGNNRVRRVSPDGIITTIAGNGASAGNGGSMYSGDGGPATSAAVHPIGVAVDRSGNLFIVDFEGIRKVSTSGIITTVSGVSAPVGSGATTFGMAVDSAGNLFIAEIYHNRVRKISVDGIITTVAGNGTPGFSGDGGPAVNAQLHHPSSVAVDAAGNLFIVDFNYYEDGAPEGNRRVRKVASDGIIMTVAGGGRESPGDGRRATDVVLAPIGVAVDSVGNLFVADQDNGRIRKVTPHGIITTVVGNGEPCCYSGDGASATSAQLFFPAGLALDAGGNLLIADGSPIRKLSPDGTIATIAGNGAFGFSGDGGPAASAQLGLTSGIAVDASGNVFLADVSDGRVRKNSIDGVITTVAGNGSCCFSGDGGPAINASVPHPTAVAVDGAGNLFIATISDIQRVLKVSPNGIISTVAGGGRNDPGDGGPASSAYLFYPRGLAVDDSGNLYIADGPRVRKVSPSGIITTVAGNGTFGFSGDGELATTAQLYSTAVTVDSSGNLFIADHATRRIRKVSASGIIATVAGNGSYGFSGDGGPATRAQLTGAAGLAADSTGNIYLSQIAENGNLSNAVRVLRPTNQPILIGAVMDAASQRNDSVSPGKIVVVYGDGLGPSELIQNRAVNGRFSAELSGTTVSFNGLAAPILYTSATQVAVIVPYGLSGATARVQVTYQAEVSAPFGLTVAVSAPGLFTLNQTGAGQAAAINALDGTVNTAANPVKIGEYISLYATGEGQTLPGGVDGKVMGSDATGPVLRASVTVRGVPATIQYAGGAPGQVAGLMQVNVRIPDGVEPGGFVPVVMQVGDRATTAGAVWIAVAGK